MSDAFGAQTTGAGLFAGAGTESLSARTGYAQRGLLAVLSLGLGEDGIDEDLGQLVMLASGDADAHIEVAGLVVLGAAPDLAQRAGGCVTDTEQAHLDEFAQVEGGELAGDAGGGGGL